MPKPVVWVLGIILVIWIFTAPAPGAVPPRLRSSAEGAGGRI